MLASLGALQFLATSNVSSVGKFLEKVNIVPTFDAIIFIRIMFDGYHCTHANMYE